MEEEEIPVADLVDDAIAALIDEIIGEEADIEEFDAASDVILDVMEELANSEEIQDPPDVESSIEDQQKWLDQYFPIVKDAIHKALHDGFIVNEEPPEELS
jgi:hypothetical protein